MTGHRWTEEEILARTRAINVVAFVVCLIVMAGFGGWGLYLITTGHFVGWAAICIAALFTIFALALGESLEDGR